MYLSNTTEKLQLILSGAVTANQLNWITSYQDITSAGMTLPQSSSQGNSNNTTDVDMVAALEEHYINKPCKYDLGKLKYEGCGKVYIDKHGNHKMLLE